jgi:hypothetical protein
MDANVLIDFLDSDETLFRLATDHIGRVHVPSPILAEELWLAPPSLRRPTSGG